MMQEQDYRVVESARSSAVVRPWWRRPVLLTHGLVWLTVFAFGAWLILSVGTDVDTRSRSEDQARVSCTSCNGRGILNQNIHMGYAVPSPSSPVSEPHDLGTRALETKCLLCGGDGFWDRGDSGYRMNRGIRR